MSTSNAPALIGWAHTPFGRSAAPDTQTLIAQVARDALTDAQLEVGEVDAMFLGVFNHGFSSQGFQSGLLGAADPQFARIPATRLENACATGSAALYAALDFIESGRGQTALVIGAEKMTHVGTAVGEILLKASYCAEEAKYGSFAGVFGHLAGEYFARYGDHSAALARIAAKNHQNGVNNPLAQIQRDLGFEFCNTVSDKNPLVAEPLRRTDCSLVSDGAAAIVVATRNRATSSQRAVAFRGRSHINDAMPLSARDPIEFAGAGASFASACAEAGVGVWDLDLLETHDCFTIAELIEYEAFGMAERGQGAHLLDEGVTSRAGRLPVNLSGGLKSKGHPIGATGVSMHVLAAMQLTGEAGAMQLNGVELAGVFNMGGTAVANYTSILERVR